MDKKIHAVNFKVSEQLESFIDEKVTKLQKYFDRIVGVDIYLKLESHHQIKDKITELKIHVPGSVLFSAESAKTFEESTILAISSMKKQLEKHKEKYAK